MTPRYSSRAYRLWALLLIITLLAAGIGPSFGHALAQDRRIVERWRGTLDVQLTADYSETLVALIMPGILREKYTLDFDLAVDESGFMNGDVRATLQTISFQQTGKCALFMMDCRVSVSVGDPVAEMFVEGERYSENGVPMLRIKHSIEIKPATMLTSASLGSAGTNSGSSEWYPEIHLLSPFKVLDFGPDLGRPPLAEQTVPRFDEGGLRYVISGQLLVLGTEPIIEIDPELLERSVFLSEVPVDDQFDGNVEWNSVDAGWVTWQLGDQPAERVGPTKAKTVPKIINVGQQGTGKRTLRAQAHNILGKTSPPKTSQVAVAQWPAMAQSAGNIQAVKQGDSVAYKFAFKFPEPPLEGKVPRVPEGIPFFGGGALGLEQTQAGGEVEVKSTGEGFAKATGETGFSAMKSKLTGAVGIKAQVVLSHGGVEFPSGEFEIKVGGKLKAEEPLIVMVPSVGVALAKLAGKFPWLQPYVAKARMALEVEPKISVIFELQDDNGNIKFLRGKAKPAVGLKASAILELIKDVLEATGTVGGEVSMTFAVPAPYFEGADLDLLAGVKVVVYHWAYEGEATYSHKLFGAAQQAAVQTFNYDPHTGEVTPLDEAGVDEPQWRLVDRSYLNSPDYGRWTAPASDLSALTAQDEATDVELVASVYPQANPAIAVKGEYSRPVVAMVWAHDKPGAAALSGQELIYSSGSYTRSLTNDDLADLNPKVVFIPNGDDRIMLLWQRFDTATPGDFNSDPGGYLSHLQVAAAVFNPNSSVQPVPLQLSTSGSLNFRHQLGATSDGALAVWVNNPANQILGDATNPDTILFSRYTYNSSGGSWTAPAPVIGSVAGLLDLHLATAGEHAALVYNRDTDGNPETDADREIFYTRLHNGTWNAPVRLTDNTVADESPQLALAPDGSPLLVWRQAGALQFLTGTWNASPVAVPLPEVAARPDFELVRAEDGSAALVWQEVEPGATRIGYAIYDGPHGAWGNARTLEAAMEISGTATMAHHIAPALFSEDLSFTAERQRLLLGYQLAELQSITRTANGVTISNTLEIGTHSLRFANIPLGANLSVAADDLAALPTATVTGQPVTIRAAIHNSGDMAVEGVPVILKMVEADGEGTYFEPTIVATHTLPIMAAGETVTLTFPATRSRLARTYSVEINPMNRETYTRPLVETNYRDNEATVGSELAITTLANHYTPDGALVRAQVSQSGGIYNATSVSATLRLGQTDGPVVGETNFGFPITPTAVVTSSGWVSATVLGEGRHLVYWELDPGKQNGEADREDNWAGTTVTILPDLASDSTLVGFGRAPGSTAPVSLRINNEGNWTSAAATVAFYDGDPSLTGTHSLGTLPVPALEPGTSAELSGTLQLSGLPAATTGLATLYVAIDPTGALDEINENNNLIQIGGLVGGPYPEDATPFGLFLPIVKR